MKEEVYLEQWATLYTNKRRSYDVSVTTQFIINNHSLLFYVRTVNVI